MDLMNDIYSLHTEKDIKHRQELRGKQAEVDQLRNENQVLDKQNKQLRYNIALLLVSPALSYVRSYFISGVFSG